jgi:hypothetical protein
VTSASESLRPKFIELGTAHSTLRNQDTPFTATTMPKRKNQAPVKGKSKKRAISDDEAHKNFDKGLFESKRLAGYTDYYAKSQPYVHSTDTRPIETV